MAKFKIGDRVRVKYKDKSKPDYTGAVTKVDEDPNDSKPLQIDGYWHFSGEAESIELLTKYTPITPKVGERYRVLKGLHFKVGEIITVNKDTNGGWYSDRSVRLDGGVNYLTTEYLELVEEAKPSEVITGAGTEHADIGLGDITYTDIDVETLPALERIKTEPIKKTIIQKTMTILRELNNWQKRTFNADTQALYRAGLINDDLSPTREGLEEMQVIQFAEYSEKLAARAKEIIAEAEAKKK